MDPIIPRQWTGRFKKALIVENPDPTLDDHLRKLGIEPHRVDDAPDDYINKMLSAIVGLRIKVHHIEAKRKLSQNKPQHDRLGAAEALLRSDRQRDREVGSLMRSADG